MAEQDVAVVSQEFLDWNAALLNTQLAEIAALSADLEAVARALKVSKRLCVNLINTPAMNHKQWAEISDALARPGVLAVLPPPKGLPIP